MRYVCECGRPRRPHRYLRLLEQRRDGVWQKACQKTHAECVQFAKKKKRSLPSTITIRVAPVSLVKNKN